MFYQFPKDFKWGSAVWAQGVEGALNQDGKAMTVFEKGYELNPDSYYKRQSPNETLDWYHRYEEYADIAALLNHNSFRTSISWARLMPDGKNVNQSAVEFYRKMFLDLKEKGMDVWVVLYWFDMPVLFENQGGFGNRSIIKDFVHYSQTCFELFDDLVDIWYIYNEPIVDTDFKYMLEMCYPNRVDFKYQTQVIYNMVLAHAKVIEVYRLGKYQKKIGSVLNFAKVYPRSHSLEDVEAAEAVSLLYFRCFMDPLISGYFPDQYFKLLEKADIVPQYEQQDFKIIAENTMEVLGINYYFPERVMAQEDPIKKASTGREQFYADYEKPGRIMNESRGWEVYPQALYESLMMIKDEYKNIECYISENGIGIENENQFRGDNGEIEDPYRINFIEQHLVWLHKAIQDGVNLHGYHVWSFIDLWSPSNQFKNLYGLVEFDLNTKKTKLKKSAYWYSQLIKENGFKMKEDLL